MLISTKGRYALRVMIDLAQNKESGHVAMKIVAARQGISLKYLERILSVLTKKRINRRRSRKRRRVSSLP